MFSPMNRTFKAIGLSFGLLLTSVPVFAAPPYTKGLSQRDINAWNMKEKAGDWASLCGTAMLEAEMAASRNDEVGYLKWKDAEKEICGKAFTF